MSAHADHARRRCSGPDRQPAERRPERRASRTEDAPPMTVNVYPARGISPHLVTETLNEAGAVWNDAGITLSWRVVPAGRPEYSATPARCHQRRSGAGSAPGPNADRVGGIPSSRRARPGDSRVARQRDEAAASVRWTRPFGRSHAADTEVNVMLGRMLGRALAHELGHFLLRSRTHTRAGLMRTGRAVSEFIAPGRRGFERGPAQRPPSSSAFAR